MADRRVTTRLYKSGTEHWASTAVPPAAPVAPSDAARILGHGSSAPLASSLLNYADEDQSRRAYLQDTYGHMNFTSMVDAHDSSDAADIVTVSDYDPTKKPGAVDVQYSTATTGKSVIAVDGRRALWSDVNDLHGLDLDGNALPGYGGPYAHGAQIEALVAIGDGTVFLGGASGTGTNTHRRINADGMSVVWSADHGATVQDIEDDGDQVYVCGLAGTGPNTIRGVNRASGANVWSQNLGTDLRGVSSSGEYVATCGVIAGGNNVWILNRTTGATLTGALFDSTAQLWDVIMSGHMVFVCGGGGASNKVVGAYHVNYGAGSMTLVWDFATSITVDQLAFDGRHLYAMQALGGGYVVTVFDPHSGHVVDILVNAVTITVPYDIASDGHRLYVSGTDEVGSYHWPKGGQYVKTSGLARYSVGNRSALNLVR